MSQYLHNGHSAGTQYRPDIDGLRALAVMAVMFFHAFPATLPGGYVGVDVFFVISGYLITTIILQDHDRGRFSLASFYGRRIRRIFPALALVLLTCLILGWHVLLTNEYAQLGLHVAAGAGFFSNVALWKESGYFDTASQLKPLLHLWSLGIEEQFYIVWPCIIWIVSKLKAQLRLVALWIFGASFAWNVLTLSHDTASAFYLPDGRAWELGVGACLAIFTKKPTDGRLSFLQAHRNLLSAAGLLLIMVAMGLLSEASAFPGAWALLPTLGAAFLIASDGAWINKNLLAGRVLVMIGLISYPLYLWHWPLLSLGRLLENGELSLYSRWGLLCLAVLLAALTHLFVERPLRHRGRRVTVTLVIIMGVVAGMGWNVYSRDGLEFRYRKIIELPLQMKRDFTRWEDKGMYPVGVCSPDFVYPGARLCVQSKADTPASTIVFGDSHAFHAYWGIAKAFANDNRVVKLVGRGGCTFALFGGDQDCRQTFDSQLDWIAKNSDVKTVILVHRLVIRDENSIDEKTEYQSRLEAAIAQLTQRGKQVIYYYPVPELGYNPRLCTDKLPWGRKADGSKCDFQLARELSLQSLERELVTDWLKQFPNLRVFDPAPFLCPRGQCLVTRDGQVLWMDDNHITETASYMLGEAMVRSLQLK